MADNSSRARACASVIPANSSGTATFSSAVMVGMRWNDWNTMPTWRPRKRASASSSSEPKSSPATVTVPVSARSNPAITISSVDLPEPDGPTRPTASPAPILMSISLRIWTRAAPCPSERLTQASSIATCEIAGPAWELSFMSCHRSGPSYGNRTALVQRLPALLLALTLVLGSSLAQAQRTMQIVVLGDSLSAGLGLAEEDAFPGKLARALQKKGHAISIANAGVSGDTASGGLARLDRSVPEGTQAVIVELGANDMLRGIDPAVTKGALDEILRRLERRHIAVLLVGMKSVQNFGPD